MVAGAGGSLRHTTQRCGIGEGVTSRGEMLSKALRLAQESVEGRESAGRRAAARGPRIDPARAARKLSSSCRKGLGGTVCAPLRTEGSD